MSGDLEQVPLCVPGEEGQVRASEHDGEQGSGPGRFLPVWRPALLAALVVTAGVIGWMSYSVYRSPPVPTGRSDLRGVQLTGVEGPCESTSPVTSPDPCGTTTSPAAQPAKSSSPDPSASATAAAGLPDHSSPAAQPATASQGGTGYDVDIPGGPIEVRNFGEKSLVQDSVRFATFFLQEKLRKCRGNESLAKVRVLSARTQVVAGISVMLDVQLVPSSDSAKTTKSSVDVLWKPGGLPGRFSRFGMTATTLQIFRSSRRVKVAWCEIFKQVDPAGGDGSGKDKNEEKGDGKRTTNSARRLGKSRYVPPQCDGSESLPAEYNLRYHPVHGQCFDKGAVTNQGSCGTCSFFSAKHAMDGRLCMQNYTDFNENSDGLGRRYISVQASLSCGAHSLQSGCQGGWQAGSFEEWKRGGAPLERDYPYRPTQNLPCQWGYVPKPYRVTDYYDVPARNIEEMKRELYCNGPFTVVYAVHENFGILTNGVYDHIEGDKTGGHAGTVVGYGTLNGVEYWEILNSWGSGWGDDGYIKIKRGVNLAAIEGGPLTAPVVERTQASWIYDGEFGECRVPPYYTEPYRGQGVKCVSHANLSIDIEDAACPLDNGWPDKSVFPRDLPPDDKTFAEKPPVAKELCTLSDSSDCTDVKFCGGWGKAVDLQGGCACECQKGYGGKNCDVCAAGYEGYPTCLESCQGSEYCNGHGDASGVKWLNEFGQPLDTCECDCEPEYRGTQCETKVHCTIPLNEDSAQAGRCGPDYGRCNAKQADWALYCDELTGWCGDQVTIGSCPKSHPYAYRPKAGFDYCCSSPDDCNGNVGKNAGRLGPDRGDCCPGNAYSKCSSPPCSDYSDDASAVFDYETAGCLACSDDEFCTGHGSAGEEQGRCSCDCSEGYGGTNCDVCALGYEGYPTCRMSCSDSEDCSGHGLASGVRWKDEFGQAQDTCACHCDPEYTGSNCEVELSCPIPLNEDSSNIGRCGPIYGRCNAKQADWALYCDEATAWCGDQVTQGSCPKTQPYAYRPTEGFDRCCSSPNDCHGNKNKNAGRLGPDRGSCCGGYTTFCKTPPCSDYGDNKSATFDYETAGCLECTDRVFCGGHGSARKNQGTCACDCSEGFDGAHCDACAPGYEGYPTCRMSCSDSVDCSNHGTASGVKWKNELGQAQDTCECDCGFGYQGDRCEVELVCPIPLNADSASSGRCGPTYGRCNARQEDWALYCDERTGWCGDQVTRGSCPGGYPYAYRPKAGFDYCCASPNDCHETPDKLAGRLGPDRGDCCGGGNHHTQCSDPPCSDYGDTASDAFDYVTSGCQVPTTTIGKVQATTTSTTSFPAFDTCPDGYDEILFALSGKTDGDTPQDNIRSIVECKELCLWVGGCTAFEYSGKEGRCTAYSDGLANVQKSRQEDNYISCLASSLIKAVTPP